MKAVHAALAYSQALVDNRFGDHRTMQLRNGRG